MNRLILPALMIGLGIGLAAPQAAHASSATCQFRHWFSVTCTSQQGPPTRPPVGCEPIPGAPVYPTAVPTSAAPTSTTPPKPPMDTSATSAAPSPPVATTGTPPPVNNDPGDAE